MTKERAMLGTYSDMKLIKTRGVIQAIIEFPIESRDEFVATFGLPHPAEEISVKVIVQERPQEISVVDELASKTKRAFTDLPYSQQAALLCKDARFRERYYTIGIFHGEKKVLNEEEAAQKLREKLGLISRSELDDVNNGNARSEFRRIRDEFHTTTKSYHGQRG